MKAVGFTTTIPLEILHAARRVPVDLNNRFITHPDLNGLLRTAERDGFPRNVCSWIKGIYAVALQLEIDEVIAVTQGDCSNTQALMETLQWKGITAIPFFYPYDRDPQFLALSMEKLMRHFAVDDEQCLAAKGRLDTIRRKVHRIDDLTWKENTVSGWENHYFQVSTSDMNGDFAAFDGETERFLASLSQRQQYHEDVRIGYIGVPPLISDLYSFIESLNARVVFNEMQRQFSMPYQTQSLVDQYLRYTCPYDIFMRIADIRQEINKRSIDGMIHYVQSFCFRQIEDPLFKKSLAIPTLTIEGDQPSALDSRNKMKIEVFIEMLRLRKARPS